MPGRSLNGGRPFDNLHLGAGEIITGEGGYIGYFMPDLTTWFKENNTPFWVEQVWNHYRWTGDRQFVRDLWPMVRKAVAWERRQPRPGRGGLVFQLLSVLECRFDGRAGQVGRRHQHRLWDARGRRRVGRGGRRCLGAAEYRALAEKTRKAAERELWNEKAGVLGSIGSDGLSYSHPHSWEETLAINMGLLDPGRGRRAMRWVGVALRVRGRGPTCG